ncbi:MAG: hypothetical protein NC548_27100 [Lachnospiraceae bacterium]|nr:hypothetical protein [Lachnospiraceae bacterium]
MRRVSSRSQQGLLRGETLNLTLKNARAAFFPEPIRFRGTNQVSWDQSGSVGPNGSVGLVCAAGGGMIGSVKKVQGLSY